MNEGNFERTHGFYGTELKCLGSRDGHSVRKGSECIVTEEGIVRALSPIGNGKAWGESDVANEPLKAAEVGVDLPTDLCTV